MSECENWLVRRMRLASEEFSKWPPGTQWLFRMDSNPKAATQEPTMSDGAERMLALHMKGGIPNRPGRKRPLYTCALCGEHKRGVRGVMQHQNQFHHTQWPDHYILADQDPDKNVWLGYAVPKGGDDGSV